MSIPGSVNPLFLGAAGQATGEGGYLIERSLRFNSADSAYLSRTPASAGNRKTWTWAGWVKKTTSGSFVTLAGVYQDGSNYSIIDFSDGNTLRIQNLVGGSYSHNFVTTQVFRDSSAWFHLVIASNSNTSFKVYVNGSEVTSFSTQTGPSTTDWFFNSTNAHYIGQNGISGFNFYLNGYLADIHFIDGQALDPTSFGEFDATTGVWVPIEYTGTYGTNGFRLDFSDNSAATATTLGKDRAGSNNWTPNNLSVTAGAGNDSLVDVPTNGAQTDTGAGGEVRGNYCTLNPLVSTSGPISNGNLEMVGASAWRNTKGTISVSTGRWYFEATYSGIQWGSTLLNLAAGIGFAKSNTATPNVDVTDISLYGSILAFSQTGHINNFNAPTSARSQIADGDVIGFALNYDTGTYTIYVNNTSTSSGSLNFTGELTPWSYAYYSNSYFILNFGQRPFAYTAPSGFKALNTANLPAPVVTKPSDLFDVKLYTGNGSTQTISGLGFSPDFAWFKGRSAAENHVLSDTVRGADRQLFSNLTNAEQTNSTYVTSFTSDGFSLGSNTGTGGNNINGTTYAAWCWDAGSSTVTNTQGSISSQVRANASAGFSVSTFTKTANTNETIGHGLGVAPSLVIVKTRESSGYTGWAVYHISTGSNGYLELNTTSVFNTLSTTWNNTAPTSSVFSMGTGWTATQNMVAYCFAPVSGYSAFGSYIGNGSADGPFVYTGFRPRWIMLKNTTNIWNWQMRDTSRSPSNPATARLFANTSDAESSNDPVDILSNGFKLRLSEGDYNASGNTYIYAAWAESPFGLNNRAR
jgi:hypothetical protein